MGTHKLCPHFFEFMTALYRFSIIFFTDDDDDDDDTETITSPHKK